jgi:uncharacterized protein (TIGR03066 family)
MTMLARLVAVFGVIALLTGTAVAADKNKDLIVGKWEPADVKDKKASAVIEFTKTGELKIVVKGEGLNFDIKGTYKFIDDNTVEITVDNPLAKGEKKSDKMKIKSISGDDMVIENAQGKEEKMKRIK